MAKRPTTKQPQAPKTTSLRLAPEIRELIEMHGHGELSEGLHNLVRRQHALMRRSLPELGSEECKAICGALKGYPLWADPEVGGHMAMGPALAMEVHDYQWCEPVEAAQWKLDKAGWLAMEAACQALSNLQVLALAHAVEAFFEDRDGDTDTKIRRHFRVTAAA